MRKIIKCKCDNTVIIQNIFMICTAALITVILWNYSVYWWCYILYWCTIFWYILIGFLKLWYLIICKSTFMHLHESSRCTFCHLSGTKVTLDSSLWCSCGFSHLEEKLAIGNFPAILASCRCHPLVEISVVANLIPAYAMMPYSKYGSIF